MWFKKILFCWNVVQKSGKCNLIKLCNLSFQKFFQDVQIQLHPNSNAYSILILSANSHFRVMLTIRCATVLVHAVCGNIRCSYGSNYFQDDFASNSENSDTETTEDHGLCNKQIEGELHSIFTHVEISLGNCIMRFRQHKTFVLCM